MTHYLIDLDTWVVARLDARAKRHGRSTEEEIRIILSSVPEEEAPRRGQFGLGSRIAARFAKSGLAIAVRELHSTLQAPSFGRRR